MIPRVPTWLAGALDGVIVREETGDRPLTPAERARYRDDAEAWWQAATLRELGLLTADWLEGRNLYLPAYGATCPDPETRELIPTLAAANRAGYVTYCSQPGHDPHTGFDGWQWQQLAAVCGFCDEHTAASLYAAVTRDTGIVAYTWPPGEKRRSDLFDVPATIRQHPATGDVWVNTVFGPPLSRRDLRGIYRGDLPRPAIKTLQRSWQVTLFDPEYGRNDRLWPLLDQWAARVTNPVTVRESA